MLHAMSNSSAVYWTFASNVGHWTSRHFTSQTTVRFNLLMKSGFVCIIGRPNSGKSTLLNRLIGEKISIVTDKPQTTRNVIRGILTIDEAQVVFLDTPGIHKPIHKMNERMMKFV